MVNVEESAISLEHWKSLHEWVQLYPKVSSEKLVDLLKAKYRMSFARSWEQVSAWRLAERLLLESQRQDR